MEMHLNNLISLNINIVSDRCFSQMFTHAAVLFNSVADYVIYLAFKSCMWAFSAKILPYPTPSILRSICLWFFFKIMYVAYLVFRWDVSFASGNLSSPSLRPGILVLLSQSGFEHSLDAACLRFHRHTWASSACPKTLLWKMG